MEKMTAERLYDITVSENRPFDYKKIEHIRRTYSRQAQVEWAKETVRYCADPNASKNLITRAARLLVRRVILL